MARCAFGLVTMADKNRLKQIVEGAVSHVLETHIPSLREDLVNRVLEEVEPQLAAGSQAGPNNGPADLLKAVSAIHAGTTQREILRGLLDSTVRYSGRAALFVVKAGAATGWEGRGFAHNDGIKNFALDVASGVPSRTLQSRMTFTGKSADMDAQFMAQIGAPADDNIIMLPLLLKDKVAALIYADAGTASGHMDEAALELLVLSTSAWLEVASLRKQAHKDGGEPVAEQAVPAPVQTVSSFSDPFAGHSPTHAAKAVVMDTPAPAVEAEPEPVSASAAAAPAAALDAFSHLSPEDADMHRKAQRFARLLVDEIKLYNQAKVTEGRKNKDVYDRLREDIEKSRATYSKRYGNTAAASADYFNNELVRSLAEDDGSIMGANFRR
jgi:hypothetical protein